MLNKIKYNCVFGGGGVRGICYIGAVKAIEEFNIKLNKIAGSSVGAVFAMLYAVGYSADEIKDFFMEFNFNMFRDINIHIFDGDVSLSKGEIFLDWLREKIEKNFYGDSYKKGENNPVRFKDIETDLSILTLDINTYTPYIFSKENTPDEEIAKAVRISAGMPGLMKPIQENEKILVDGDLIKTRPAFKIYDSFNTSDERLLEFRLEGTRDSSDIKNPSDYINSVISTIWYLSTEYIYDLYHENDRYDFIIIDAKEVIMFDFTIDKTKREALIDKGYNTTKDYLINTLIAKKKRILAIYNEIKIAINKTINFINKRKYSEALFVILSLLSFNEDLKLIDNSIYEEIVTLKKIITEDIKKNTLFTLKIFDTKFGKEAKEKTKLIISLLDIRIDDIENYIENTCKKI